MKKRLSQRLVLLFTVLFTSLGLTSCVHGFFSASEWKTFDGVLIVIVSLFLIGYTLATIRSSKPE